MHKKGFTLIELLVVVAIIGILAALVLVALGNARDKAQQLRVRSAVEQLSQIAEILYSEQYDAYLQITGCFNWGGNRCPESVRDSVRAIQIELCDAINLECFFSLIDGQFISPFPSFTYEHSRAQGGYPGWCIIAYLVEESRPPIWCQDSTGATGSLGCDNATGAWVCPQ